MTFLLELGSLEQQSGEDLEARYEEDRENREDLDEQEGEDPLYAQLRREEREDLVNKVLGQIGISPSDVSEGEEETDDY